jgi:hypothetical protein
MHSIGRSAAFVAHINLGAVILLARTIDAFISRAKPE